MANERVHDEALRELGMFTAVFNEVELGLHMLIVTIVGLGEASATAAVTQEMGFRDLTGALRRLAKTDSVPTALKNDIRELVTKATALNTERNRLLHSRIVMTEQGPPQFTRLRDIGSTFWGAPSGREMTAREIRGLIAQALEIGSDLYRVVDSIGSQSSDI